MKNSLTENDLKCGMVAYEVNKMRIFLFDVLAVRWIPYKLSAFTEIFHLVVVVISFDDSHIFIQMNCCHSPLLS